MGNQNKPFKSQKEYIQHQRCRQRCMNILSIVCVVMAFLLVILKNPYSIAAWAGFAAFVLFIIILHALSKKELLKVDRESFNKEEQARLFRENKKRLGKHK